MAFHLPDPAYVQLVLRGLKSVAAVDGALNTQERAILNAAQEVLQSNYEIDALERITPEELAAELSEELREQILNGMIIMSLIDEHASQSEVDMIQSFAKALGVTVNELHNMQQIVDGNILRLKLDVARRVWLMDHIRDGWKEGGVKWALKAAATLKGIKEDTVLANRYRTLADYPEGTVGRIYFDHMREEGFALPGEKGSQIEAVVCHDMTHLLSGYGTDPRGETLTACFSAGYRGKDPFTFVFFVLCQNHLGLFSAPFAGKERGCFEPAKAIEALHRGSQVKVDLSYGWDAWSIMDKPIEVARKELGVPELSLKV